MNAGGQSHSQTRSLRGLPGTINDDQRANMAAATRFEADVSTLSSREQVKC